MEAEGAIMQSNLGLIIWTVIGFVAAWVFAMSISRNSFLHYDVDASVVGVVNISKTDIGDQCGTDAQASDEKVDYKLDEKNKIVYLCPQTWWPIQDTVIAATITDAFKNSLSPAQQAKVIAAYPEQQKQAPANPFIAPSPPSQ